MDGSCRSSSAAASASFHACWRSVSIRIDLPWAARQVEPDAMRINSDKCVACGNCTYVCPMGAIYIDPSLKRATINRDECVECYACYNGLSQEHMNPTVVRTMRKIFQFMRLRF